MKELLKSLACGALYYSGGISLLKSVQRSRLGSGVSVIGYHRVVAQPLDMVTTAPHGMVVTRDTFERQIRYLSRRWRIMDLPEVIDLCERRRPMPARACIITFDDGWRDNYDVAFPVLQRYRAPATILLTSDYIGTTDSFWYSRLIPLVVSDAFRRFRPEDRPFDGCPDAVWAELVRLRRIGTPLVPRHADPLLEIMKRFPIAEIEAVVSRLAACLDAPAQGPEGRLMLNWDEVRELRRGGVAMGAHSRSHRILTQLTAEDARGELVGSKADIEKQLGCPVESMAFPNGNCSDALLGMVWEAGYRVVFLSVKPGNERYHSSKVLPAFCMDDGSSAGLLRTFSPSRFAFKLSGATGLLRRG
ncbi:MAG: polysaccharide deacetylase family protein [Nitrospirota bacterium]